jgi:hypothetical protein
MDASAWASSFDKNGLPVQLLLVDYGDGNGCVITVDVNERATVKPYTMYEAMREYIRLLSWFKRQRQTVIIRK